ncbi:hypothetical protein COT69_00735 [candidate division WWE3 bacterium CG09_land_8_20_14_0_10_39_24]|uniref:Uncharacterized protein n=1 Tax=candidate division WWE3 bacterium CG09_land_8_20_14_0_10_39_24 TaxID=1975088 RepID=A0A2H0WK70_UNCKA|nr:MAG: hypothetical protein BK003_00715 [bacterium CG09_39_24]PIS13072.1 MAG: hypothetical protein COT69_00735 [candidate division WWE3 bacterium CG09_land_8_20_14_0_10_39_24]
MIRVNSLTKPSARIKLLLPQIGQTKFRPFSWSFLFRFSCIFFFISSGIGIIIPLKVYITCNSICNFLLSSFSTALNKSGFLSNSFILRSEIFTYFSFASIPI